MFDISGAFKNWDETQMAVLRKIQEIDKSLLSQITAILKGFAKFLLKNFAFFQHLYLGSEPFFSSY
jgi:hypothetical protein